MVKKTTKTTKPKSKNKYWYRPPKYETPEEMEEVINDYFKNIMDSTGKFFLRPPTVSGLAFHLDMSTRALLEYEKKDDFLPIITRAKRLCEYYLEEQAIVGNSRNPISLLSMNFGRHEKAQVDVNHKNKIDSVSKELLNHLGITVDEEEPDPGTSG